MMLLPPAEDVCPICAGDHAADAPHNAQSLYYQYRFYGTRGRWPTWADAIAHCSPDVQKSWRGALLERGAWTEPAEGEPIADPPAESINQPIGDVNEPTFGPTPVTSTVVAIDMEDERDQGGSDSDWDD